MWSFWPLALVQQAQAAIVLAVLCRLGGAALFRGSRPSSNSGYPFWLLALTFRSSRPAFCGRLTSPVRKFMKAFLTLLHFLYWLAVAYIPLAIRALEAEIRTILGCPSTGECYVKGWGVLASIQICSVYATLILWPLCLFFLWRLFSKAFLTRRCSGLPTTTTEL